MHEQFSMSKFATKTDRQAAINQRIDVLAKKRDYAADVLGKPLLAWTYQTEIDQMVALLTPN